MKYFHCNIYCLLIVLRVRHTFKWKLSSNSLAISDVFKKTHKKPETGLSQHRCGSDGDVLSTMFSREVWLICEMYSWTHTCVTLTAACWRTHTARTMSGSFDLYSSNSWSFHNPPNVSSDCVSLSLAGFRCSRSPITCRLPSQHRCLSEVLNHHRNGTRAPASAARGCRHPCNRVTRFHDED